MKTHVGGFRLTSPSYFVNDEDEIRSLDNSDNYFKFFLTKNQRHNDRQRYAMNGSYKKHARCQYARPIPIPFPVSRFLYHNRN